MGLFDWSKDNIFFSGWNLQYQRLLRRHGTDEIEVSL
jgi:hypothetical protein